jgi:hypothetical protein
MKYLLKENHVKQMVRALGKRCSAGFIKMSVAYDPDDGTTRSKHLTGSLNVVTGFNNREKVTANDNQQ